MSEKLSERLIERAEFEDERVLKEAKAMGFVPEVYSGSQTGALLREAAAVLRAVEGDAWQPIETAPRDVDVIVYCFGASIPQRIAMLCEGDKWLDTGCNKLDMFPPTHWRPLPAPPLDAAGSAEGVGGG